VPRWFTTEYREYLHHIDSVVYHISSDLMLEFDYFSMTTVIFLDFPDLENNVLKFYDFP